jgi:hypothetical protein
MLPKIVHPSRERYCQSYDNIHDCHCDEELPDVGIRIATANLRDVHAVNSGNDSYRREPVLEIRESREGMQKAARTSK